MIEAVLVACSVAVLLAACVYSQIALAGARRAQRYASILFPSAQIAIVAVIFTTVSGTDAYRACCAIVCAASVCCAFADAALFRAMAGAQRHAIDEERARLIESQLSAERENELSRIRERDKAAETESELLGRVQSIRTALEAGDACAVGRTIRQASDLLSSGAPEFCANHAVDAIMRIKAVECRRKGIPLTCALDVRADLPLPSVDLCAVFANIMDNAIKAASECPAEKRFISVSAGVAVGMFVVDVTNSAMGAKIDAQASPPSVVGDHGWGLVILDDIAKRFDGYLETALAGQSFKTTVMLSVFEENAE